MRLSECVAFFNFLHGNPAAINAVMVSLFALLFCISRVLDDSLV